MGLETSGLVVSTTGFVVPNEKLAFEESPGVESEAGLVAPNVKTALGALSEYSVVLGPGTAVDLENSNANPAFGEVIAVDLEGDPKENDGFAESVCDLSPSTGLIVEPKLKFALGVSVVLVSEDVVLGELKEKLAGIEGVVSL